MGTSHPEVWKEMCPGVSWAASAKTMKASASETAGEEVPGLATGCLPTLRDGHLKAGAPGVLSLDAHPPRVHPAVGVLSLRKSTRPKRSYGDFL